MDSEKVDALGVELARITADLRAALEPAFTQIAAAVGQMTAVLSESLSQISAAWQQNPSWEFVLAYAWACETQPKWVNILNRTKKDRTRKKYQDRILRAYRNRDDVKGE
jgi:hypothetical protein